MFNFFKKKQKQKSINLKEFAEIRKNKETIYSDEDVINYCLELIKKNLIKYEEVNTDDIKEKYSNSNEKYRYLVWIKLKNVYTKFVGLTTIDILEIINKDKEFNNKVEKTIKDFLGKNVLEEITYKTEFEFTNVEDLIKHEKDIKPFGKGKDTLYAYLYLYFKY